MNSNPMRARVAFLVIAASELVAFGAFVNFETAPVHPVALSPDRRCLAICNLPDGRIELFDVSGALPVPCGSSAVGIDPVTVRFRTINELWVANRISASVNVVELDRMQVVATIDRLPGVSDVVFAGVPMRAFVSCAGDNTVRVFNPDTLQAVTNLVLDAERPTALAVSPDGGRVYAAIFESGNASTILAPRVTPFDITPEPSVVSHPEGPHGGQDPPPNNGAGYDPPLNPDLGPYPAPRGSHIVRKNAAGRWMDDNHGDWTEFVCGTNAALSGRVAGWDMPDRDVAIIDARTFAIAHATGLMNLCMDVAVNPATGTLAVIGTDAANERRFEPNLRGTFVRAMLALVDPVTLEKRRVDLNPHLDYARPAIPQSGRDLSIGDPRGFVWSAAGTRGYVTGMGSRNLVVIDADGGRVVARPIELGEGPTGLALDESRGRLYVWNRFSSTVTLLDTAALTVVTNVPIFDPTPAAIRRGRRHLYDTRINSGLGQASCASCHVDARFDRLAWDLGNPAGGMSFQSIPGLFETNVFHPMKGPMVTQTLQDMLGVKHWRGDRAGIEDFNGTFTDLLGRDARLTTNEMRELKEFLASIVFPPNRFRDLDNRFSSDVPLSGHTGLDGEGNLDDTPLPNGNAQRGFTMFAHQVFAGRRTCDACHNGDSGNGFEVDFIALARNHGEGFKGQQLRGLSEKLGMNLGGPTSRAGFGFLHDGRADTLTRFLVEGAGLGNNQDLADMIAFLLSFSGGLTATGSDSDHIDQGVPAGVGRQLTLTASLPTPRLIEMLRAADDASNPVDLVARGRVNGVPRGWAHVQGHNGFQSDDQNQVTDLASLLSLASPDAPVTLTLVPGGSGQRIGIDRDEDGYFDRTEFDAGTDPLDPNSKPLNSIPQWAPVASELRVHPGRAISTFLSAFDADSPPQTLILSLGGDVPPGATFDPASGRIGWRAPNPATARSHTFYARATDDGSPTLSGFLWMTVTVVDLRILRVTHEPAPFGRHWDVIYFDGTPGSQYRLQFKSRLEDDWFEHPFLNSIRISEDYLFQLEGSSAERHYRLRLVGE